MGRKTYESLPVKPLPNRLNVVISSEYHPEIDPKVIQMRSVAAVMFAFKDIQADLMIIGGGRVYDEAIHYADQVFLTEVHQTIEGDNLTFFPKLSKEDWQEEARLPGKNPEIPFDFVKYSRRAKAST